MPARPAGLPSAYWLGGGSGAGKSTIARRLAAAHGLRVYATDDVMSDHGRRCPPDEAPFLQAFLAMDMDQRWLHRSPATMLDTFPWYRGECFDLVLRDLAALPAGPPVLVEGFRLLPRLVRPLLDTPHRALWLLPTPSFRRLAFASRASTWDIAGRTSDPARALDNLLVRDRRFTDGLRGEVSRLGLPSLEVGSGMTEDDLVRSAATAFGLGRPRPPGDDGATPGT